MGTEPDAFRVPSYSRRLTQPVFCKWDCAELYGCSRWKLRLAIHKIRVYVVSQRTAYPQPANTVGLELLVWAIAHELHPEKAQPHNHALGQSSWYHLQIQAPSAQCNRRKQQTWYLRRSCWATVSCWPSSTVGAAKAVAAATSARIAAIVRMIDTCRQTHRQ